MNNDQYTPTTTKINNIFASYASKYFEAGYNILPIEPNSKAVKMPNWTRWCDVKQNPMQIDQWIETYPNHNIGIPLGAASGIIALDFDYDIDGIHGEVMELIKGDMLIKKKGAKGFTVFFQYNGESPKKWYKDGKAVLELLSTGNQTVMPPSIHPATKEAYQWLTIDNLYDYVPSDLPRLPTGFLEAVNTITGYTKKLDKYTKFEGTAPTIDEMKRILSFIPSVEYATWLSVGMGLHHTYSQAGFALWDEWSSGAFNYDHNIMAGKWSSFGRRSDIVTVGSIIHYAIGCGYIPVGEQLPFDMPKNMTIIYPWDEKYDKETGEVKEDKIEAIGEFPQELLNHAPGLVGEMARWINEVAIRPQPILALAASLSACGAIYGQRIISGFSGERPNIYTMGVAPTGGGKDSARICIDNLFTACGLENMIFGDPSSDTGLLNALDSTLGRGFIAMDELGRKLQGLARSKNSHEARILDALMQLFTSSGGIYRGKEYADRRNFKRTTLKQPHLCIYGTTTKKTLYDAFTSDAVIDGFINRWLIFEAPDKKPRKRSNVPPPVAPDILIENIKAILKNYPLRTDAFLNPKPLAVEISDGAKKRLTEFSEYCDDVSEANLNSVTNSLWSRTAEIAGKIALIAHPYQEGAIIETTTADWACDLTLYLTNKMIGAVKENVSDTDHEKNLKRIANIIKQYSDKGGRYMVHKDVCKFTNFIKARERNEILSQLVESGVVLIKQDDTGGRPVYSYKYNN